MDLQTIFYIFGIIYALLGIFILLGIIIVMFIIIKVVRDIHKQVTEKLQLIEKFIESPEETISRVAASFIKSAIRKAKKTFTRPKGTEDEV